MAEFLDIFDTRKFCVIPAEKANSSVKRQHHVSFPWSDAGVWKVRLILLMARLKGKKKKNKVNENKLPDNIYL